MIALAFSNEYKFMDVSEAILPLLCPIELDHVILPYIRPSEGEIVNKHPKRVLEILDRALPENANIWPWGIDETLKHLVVADPALQNDAKWIELMRRWNSR